MRTQFTGVGTALVTPFTRSGDLDEKGVRRLGRRQIDAGIHFLVPNGTTGENPTLTLAERIRIVEILVDEAAGKVPILAGAGGYNTKEVVHLADEMRKAGASGCSPSRPITTSPRPTGWSSTSARSPTARRCRSSSTTCPAGPASTST